MAQNIKESGPALSEQVLFRCTRPRTSLQREGGMITTDDDDIAEKCKVIRNHGMRRRYYHDEIGYNFRMTDVHAAIGNAQLAKLDDS